MLARIRFAPGTSSTTVRGHVDAGRLIRYVLQARGGQVMHVLLRSQDNRAGRVEINGPQDILLGIANNGVEWTGTLPATQAYYLNVIVPEDSASYDYSLYVEIPP